MLFAPAVYLEKRFRERRQFFAFTLLSRGVRCTEFAYRGNILGSGELRDAGFARREILPVD